MKLHITILKYHSWYLCQISLLIMLLPILIRPRLYGENLSQAEGSTSQPSSSLAGVCTRKRITPFPEPKALARLAHALIAPIWPGWRRWASQSVFFWRRVGPAMRMSLPSQKDNPATQVILLAPRWWGKRSKNYAKTAWGRQSSGACNHYV